MVEDIRGLLESYDSSELRNIHVLIEEILGERSELTQVPFEYDLWRQHFLSRFDPNQVMATKPWKTLPKAKRAEVVKVWNQAILHLRKQGFTNDSVCARLVRVLVLGSPFFEGHLTFEGIVQSIKGTPELFERAYPGYSGGEGIWLLQEQLTPLI